MSTKFTTTYLVSLVLALFFVLIDHSNAMAFGLDPSEIKVAEIVEFVSTYPKACGGAAVATIVVVRTWIFADGHTERADDGKKKTGR